MNRLEKAFSLFDDYNKQDPNTIRWADRDYPLEYFFALRVYDWVRKLDPDASDALLLASRSQHIGRWTSPRSSYPEGKAGYLSWRADLAKFHAATATGLMKEAGYEDDIAAKVQHIILKKDLRNDLEVQTMENALCLVFLEFQFEDFITRHDEKKVIRVLQKSWNKMNQQGHDAALSLSYSGLAKELLEKALS